MKIDTISIEGYKSFAKVDQFALQNLNVLIGANGAGKSNFLSLCRLLTALSQGNLQTYAKGQGGPDASARFKLWLDDYQDLGELWKRNVLSGRPSLGCAGPS